MHLAAQRYATGSAAGGTQPRRHATGSDAGAHATARDGGGDSRDGVDGDCRRPRIAAADRARVKLREPAAGGYDWRMSRLSRREFARAATVAAGAALLPRSAAAQDARDVAGEHAPAATRAAAPATAPAKLPAAAPTHLSAAAQGEADARLATILARWGARLTPQDRVAVATLAAELQAPLEALRAAPLDATDEPALQFHAPRKKH